MAYCVYGDVQTETGLTSDEIADATVISLIASATIDLNAIINVRVEDEHVIQIDNERKNGIDGSNTTYYTRRYPLADGDNDGAIGTGDIAAYQLSGTGTRTALTVSTIADDEIGKFTLSAAPSNVDVYLTYYYATLEEETPHPLVKKACIELTAAKCYQRIADGSVKSFRLGSFAIVKEKSTYAEYMSRFWNTVRQITAHDIPDGVGTNYPVD